MIRLFILLGAFSFPLAAWSQDDQQERTDETLMVKVSAMDTFAPTIALREVFVFGPTKFRDSQDMFRYLLLKRRTLKVYPYAKLAAEKLMQLNAELEKIPKRNRKKQHTKQMQRYVEGEFSDELKKMTRSEGRILIKLIHRQTGAAPFYLVKDLRGGWRAFWYSTTAKMFDLDLKSEFDPMTVREDYLIEEILQRAFADQTLQYQASPLQFDFAEAHSFWSGKKNNQ